MKGYPTGVKLTRQGVRDLGGNEQRRARTGRWSPIHQCTHRRMRECHRGCGHLRCPDCGLSFDDFGEGGGPYRW